MHKFALGVALTSTASLFSLEELPWLPDAYSFQLQVSCQYSQFSHISHAVTQPAYAYNNYVTDVALSFLPDPNLSMGVEVELARTPHELYGLRSSAIGARYLLWDDIAGDPASIAIGGEVRAVTGRAVKDVSSPYASYINFEVFGSLGKEFVKEADWKCRGYLLASLGQANKGAPWNRFEGSIEGRFQKAQVLQLFALAYLGYGTHKKVDIDHFPGWGRICHRSLDVGVRYRYIFALWGELGVSYAYRILAISYPKNAQTVEIVYTLPFSLL